jgi:glutathione S-transferase
VASSSEALALHPADDAEREERLEYEQLVREGDVQHCMRQAHRRVHAHAPELGDARVGRDGQQLRARSTSGA